MRELIHLPNSINVEKGYSMFTKRSLSKLVLFSLLATGTAMATPKAETLNIKGLHEPVEVIIDTWGIAHIYALNEHDLFFAQGFCAARDARGGAAAGRRDAQLPAPYAGDRRGRPRRV